jgi:multidrug efflux pump subunit AcrA (membrane-fusion protein)
MSVIRSLLVLLILIILLPLAASFVAAGQAARVQASELTRLQNLERYTVERGDVAGTVSALGTVLADEMVNASFETSGQVAEVLVESGDYVVAGDVIAR